MVVVADLVVAGVWVSLLQYSVVCGFFWVKWFVCLVSMYGFNFIVAFPSGFCGWQALDEEEVS